ncbi:alpha/beta fold hydrolase [Rhodococcus sp. 077-4]|uniref:alpha/beta fold hydrolase n=1 Tax=Rhodococcus sp. 077-4 TaxID=2789271 RepID=UPI0039F4F6BC
MPEDRTLDPAGALGESARSHPEYGPNSGVTREGMSTAAGHLSYLTAGPESGPLVVLVHGWPAPALTWKPQIDALSAAGFRVAAPDLRGYGGSFKPDNSDAYAQRHLVGDMRSLIEHLGYESAIWVGHDWGSATVWALAAHHPELCQAVASAVVTYRSLERGYTEMLDLVDRDLYPEATMPYAQFDYMAYYEQNAAEVTSLFDRHVEQMVRLLYRRGEAAAIGQPAFTAFITAAGGWFGDDAVLDVPRDVEVLDDDLYRQVVDSLSAGGFAGPTSYYLNHDDNRQYSDESVNGGGLTMPTLFVEAQLDPIAALTNTRLAEQMRSHCTDLVEVSISAGHWVALEASEEFNTALLGWLGDHHLSPNTASAR